MKSGISSCLLWDMPGIGEAHFLFKPPAHHGASTIESDLYKLCGAAFAGTLGNPNWLVRVSRFVASGRLGHVPREIGPSDRWDRRSRART